jgi:hypothetical protein
MKMQDTLDLGAGVFDESYRLSFHAAMVVSAELTVVYPWNEHILVL